jgi:fumarate reductase flavoprotein subunit
MPVRRTFMMRGIRKNMPVVWAGIMGFLLLVSGCPKPDRYKAGRYRASADGYGGPITVEAEFDGNALLTVSVVAEQETKDFGTMAITTLPGKMVEAQTYDVAAVSSATLTSEAIKAAVKDCMEQALVRQPAKDR